MEDRQLGDLINVQSGYAFKSKDYTDKGHFLIRIGNVQDGCLALDKPKYVTLDDRTIRFSLHEGDLLTSLTGNIGRVARVDKSHLPAALNQRVARLTIKDVNVISEEYLYYFLKSDVFKNELSSIGHGAAQQNVSPNSIKALTIPLASRSEQKRIVTILDEAFAGIDTAIANTEKNLANARELFESYLNLIFAQPGLDWKERSLDDVCGIDSNLIDPRKEEFIDLPHIGAGNIVSKTGELLDVKTAREEGLKSGKFLFNEKMVLYSKIRPYLEKVVRPDFNGLCSADIYPLMPKEGLLVRDFLYYLLLSRQFTDYAIAGSARAGMPKVNRNHLFQYVTSFPEVSIQEKLSDQLNSIEIESKRLELIYLEKLNSLKELKQSLLQKAFSGELTAEADKLMDDAVA